MGLKALWGHETLAPAPIKLLWHHWPLTSCILLCCAAYWKLCQLSGEAKHSVMSFLSCGMHPPEVCLTRQTLLEVLRRVVTLLNA